MVYHRLYGEAGLCRKSPRAVAILALAVGTVAIRAWRSGYVGTAARFSSLCVRGRDGRRPCAAGGLCRKSPRAVSSLYVHRKVCLHPCAVACLCRKSPRAVYSLFALMIGSVTTRVRWPACVGRALARLIIFALAVGSVSTRARWPRSNRKSSRAVSSHLRSAVSSFAASVRGGLESALPSRGL